MDARRFSAVFGVVALVGGLLGIGSTAGAQGSSCVGPYPRSSPARATTRPGTPVRRPTVPDVVIFQTTVLDANGDALITAATGAEIVVDRPAGQLRLNFGGAVLEATSAGDLDGEGLAEISVTDPSARRSWVVPGDTASGTYDVTAVGIEVPLGSALAALGARPDGQPMDLYLAGDDGTAVYDGEQVLAAGPGGDATGLESLAEYPDRIPLSLLRFDSGDHLVLAPVSRVGTIQVVSPSEIDRVLHAGSDRARGGCRVGAGTRWRSRSVPAAHHPGSQPRQVPVVLRRPVHGAGGRCGGHDDHHDRASSGPRSPVVDRLTRWSLRLCGAERDGVPGRCARRCRAGGHGRRDVGRHLDATAAGDRRSGASGSGRSGSWQVAMTTDS